jgi:hypothetical protein
VEVTFINRKPRKLGTCTGRALLPGKHKHELNEKELNTIMQCDQFKNWQALRWVGVQGLPGLEPAGEPEAEDVDGDAGDDSPEDALRKVNLTEAATMIAACGDPELLATWHDKDPRAGAKKAIEARLVELGAIDDADPEGDDSEE